MRKYTNFDNSVGDNLWAGILVSLVVVGVSGVILSGYAWYQGYNVPSFLINAGPFLLVLVTLINIGLSGLGFLEARKERRLTLETLTEYRKDGVIEMIVQTVEKVYNELENDKNTLDVPEQAPPVYPELTPFDRPSPDLLTDISHLCPNLTEDIENYQELRGEYETIRIHIEAEFEEMIPSILDESELDKLLKATGSSLEEVRPEPEQDVFYQRFSQESPLLSHVMLCLESPKKSKGWIDDNIAAISDVFVELRTKYEFKRYFEDIEEVRTELISKAEKIQSDCSGAKSILKDQYNIREAEIMRRMER